MCPVQHILSIDKPSHVFMMVAGLLCKASGQAEPTRHRHGEAKAGKLALKHSGQSAANPDGGRLQHPAGIGLQSHKTVAKAQPTAQCGQASIAYVKCWLDKDGYVTGIAFEDVDGQHSPSLCDNKGQHQEGGFLYEGETILEIISCRYDRTMQYGQCRPTTSSSQQACKRERGVWVGCSGTAKPRQA